MRYAVDFWLCFIPLFVAVDALGVLPMFVGLTQGLDRSKARKIAIQSVITAMAVAVLFLAVGKYLLESLGITVPDFMIAGGILLFAISLSDMLSSDKKQRRVDQESVGAVPIGVPLIVGPAVLTTIIVLSAQHGIAMTVAATLVNIFIAGVLFWFCGPIMKVMGNAGSRVVSKLASLLLASIGVMMIRKGIITFM